MSGSATQLAEYVQRDYEYHLQRGMAASDAVRVTAGDLVAVFADGDPTAFEDFDVAEFLHHTRQRSRGDWALLIAKSVSWRLISTGLLFLIAWLVTGSATTGGTVALVHMLVTIVVYVPHDLAWERLTHRRHVRAVTSD